MYNDNVFRDESGNYSVNGKLLSRQEARSLYDYMELEYFKEDLRLSLEDYKLYDDEQIDNICSNSALIEQLHEDYQDSMSNSEQWVYSMEFVIDYNKEAIEEAANSEPKGNKYKQKEER